MKVHAAALARRAFSASEFCGDGLPQIALVHQLLDLKSATHSADCSTSIAMPAA